MTVCWHVAELPCRSVTVHTTKLVPTTKLVGALLLTEATPQLSEAMGVPSTMREAKHEPRSAFTITSAGQVMVGSSISRIVTVKVQVFELPLASTAVLVTMVVPTGKLEPLG